MKTETNAVSVGKGKLEECREGSFDQFSAHIRAENSRRNGFKKKKKNVIRNLTYCSIGKVVHVGLNL